MSISPNAAWKFLGGFHKKCVTETHHFNSDVFVFFDNEASSNFWASRNAMKSFMQAHGIRVRFPSNTEAFIVLLYLTMSVS